MESGADNTTMEGFFDIPKTRTGLSLESTRLAQKARGDVFDYIELFRNLRCQRRLDATIQKELFLTQLSVEMA